MVKTLWWKQNKNLSSRKKGATIKYVNIKECACETEIEA